MPSIRLTYQQHADILRLREQYLVSLDFTRPQQDGSERIMGRYMLFNPGDGGYFVFCYCQYCRSAKMPARNLSRGYSCSNCGHPVGDFEEVKDGEAELIDRICGAIYAHERNRYISSCPA